jgi:phosphoserine phosphatase RsbU/P
LDLDVAQINTLANARRYLAEMLPVKTALPQDWQMAVHLTPSPEVAADFYDLFYLANNQIGFVIADVGDKGIEAAIFSAVVRNLLRGFAEQASEPETILQSVAKLNNYIVANHSQSGLFLTLFFGVLNPATGILHYINAGHQPALLVRNDGSRQLLAPTGIAVGLKANAAYRNYRVVLLAGDLLFAYTDGVVEAKNSEGKTFSRQALFNALENPEDSPVLMNIIIEQLNQHMANQPPEDDITMLALRRRLV